MTKLPSYSKKAEIEQRRDIVLGITVAQYIKTISPVSSKFIAEEYQLDLSPATIRNILAELENKGYLTHPHTSAGRIPTQKGYRYYVDHLMEEIQLLQEEKDRIKHEYQRRSAQLEELLDQTSQVISATTQYTSIVSLGGRGDKVYCRGTSFIVEYTDTPDIQKIRNLLGALEEKEILLSILNQRLAKKIDVYIGHEIACREMEHCSLVVSEFQSPRNRTSGRMAVLGPTRMDYERVVSALDYFSDLMEEIL